MQLNSSGQNDPFLIRCPMDQVTLNLHYSALLTMVKKNFYIPISNIRIDVKIK